MLPESGANDAQRSRTGCAGRRRRGGYGVAAVGLASGVLLLAHQKILELLVILNFSTTVLIAASLAAFALGLLRGLNGGTPIAHIARAALLALLAVAAQWNRDFTSMSYAAAIYYPVPLPRAGVLNEASLVLMFVLAPTVQGLLGSQLARHLRMAGSPVPRRVALFLASFAVGAMAVEFFSHWSPYLWFAAGLTAAAGAMLPAGTAALVAAIAVGTAAWFHTHPQRTFFLWANLDYEHLSGSFGRDVKIDFVRFWNERCVGAVPNNIMATAECRDTNWIPSEYDYILRSLVDPLNPPPARYDAEDRDLGPDPGRPHRIFRVLDIGRSGGGNARALEIYSGPNTNVAIEFEPAIAAGWRKYWDEYGGGVHSRPGARVLTGSYRANMEALAHAGESFDYVFYSGIGTKIYPHPRSYVFQEHWLLTAEGVDLTFNRLLKPDGIFWLDWGSSSTQEAKWFVAGFPRDVQVLAVWSTQSEYPFAGSPHVYVIASKSPAKIEAIRSRVRRMTGYKVIPLASDLTFFRTTDDRPFLQTEMQRMLAGVHVLLSAGWLLALGLLRRRQRLRHPAELRIPGLAIVGGVAWGLAEAQFASMDVFTFAPLGIPNWTLQHSLFLASVAAGYTISMGAQAPVRRFLPWLFAGIALPFVARSTPWAMAGAPLAGLAVGGAAAWRVLRAASAGGVVLTALLLGQVTALLLGHALAYTFGYSGTALIAGLLFFLTSVGAILARPDRTVAAS